MRVARLRRLADVLYAGVLMRPGRPTPTPPARREVDVLAAPLWLALLIVFPVIGLEQVIHTSPAALLALPLYQVLHWVSDSLLALPLGVAAVWGGMWVAARGGIGTSSLSDVFARACITTLLLAVLLVPGEALHEQVDQLTHSHALVAIHSHTPLSPGRIEGPFQIAALAAHALVDGLEGQVVGLPLAFVALLWSTRGLRRQLNSLERSPTSRLREVKREYE